MIITESIKYIGVNDHQINLFEAQYPVRNGMAYNSYLIMDEKIAVMDSVDAAFTHEWLENIKRECGNASPDFLVIQHMEPDHSASISRFTEQYPQAVIVASRMAFLMMGQFFKTAYEDRRIVVREGDNLSLGSHSLSFIEAPMVHWPEVIMTYEQTTGTLFSADAFGKFGALDVAEDWADEARRYYMGIVGKFGLQVSNLLKRAEKLRIKRICALHGPVLDTNLSYYMNLYKTWASYDAESKGVFIAYTSMYGNTEKAALTLAQMLQEQNDLPVVTANLSTCDIFQAVSDAFRYDRLVLAVPSYNGGIFPRTREFITHLTERNYQNRKVGLIENGSWAPCAAKAMKAMLEKSKNITFCDTVVTINSTLSHNSYAQIEALAEELR